MLYSARSAKFRADLKKRRRMDKDFAGFDFEISKSKFKNSLPEKEKFQCIDIYQKQGEGLQTGHAA